MDNSTEPMGLKETTQETINALKEKAKSEIDKGDFNSAADILSAAIRLELIQKRHCYYE